MRQWFQAKLGERLLQAANMSRSRELLRRGALKMQDGTLGQPGDPPGMDDPMNIRVGDEIHYHAEAAAVPAPAPTPTLAPAAKSLLARAAPYVLTAALAASGGAVAAPWLLGALGGKAAEAMIDTDTQYILELLPIPADNAGASFGGGDDETEN